MERHFTEPQPPLRHCRQTGEVRMDGEALSSIPTIPTSGIFLCIKWAAEILLVIAAVAYELFW